MELAGIEPASERLPSQDATSVSGFLSSHQDIRRTHRRHRSRSSRIRADERTPGPHVPSCFQVGSTAGPPLTDRPLPFLRRRPGARRSSRRSSRQGAQHRCWLLLFWSFYVPDQHGSHLHPSDPPSKPDQPQKVCQVAVLPGLVLESPLTLWAFHPDHAPALSAWHNSYYTT